MIGLILLHISLYLESGAHYDSPVTALVEFKPNFYDLLLIDVNMPLLEGFQLAQNLLRRDLHVRVCFMTSGDGLQWNNSGKNGFYCRSIYSP